MSKPTAIVVGVGAERGLGAALCRRFAQGGCHVLRRMVGRLRLTASDAADVIADHINCLTVMVDDAVRPRRASLACRRCLDLWYAS
jgi:NAD(P)-dependent dehydrogenase (short-subunit alcohol dehydrogenase family)